MSNNLDRVIEQKGVEIPEEIVYNGNLEGYTSQLKRIAKCANCGFISQTKDFYSHYSSGSDYLKNKICPKCESAIIYFVDPLKALIKQREKELKAKHLADISRAVGYIQGLGHPDPVLEKSKARLEAELEKGDE